MKGQSLSCSGLKKKSCLGNDVVARALHSLEIKEREVEESKLSSLQLQKEKEEAQAIAQQARTTRDRVVVLQVRMIRHDHAWDMARVPVIGGGWLCIAVQLPVLYQALSYTPPPPHLHPEVFQKLQLVVSHGVPYNLQNAE